MLAATKSLAKTLIRRTILPHDLSQRGTLTEVEYGFVRELVERANTQPGDIVEIGTLFGYTAQRLASWKAADKKIITVDQYSWNPLLLSPAEHEAVVAQNFYYLREHGHLEMVRADKNAFYASRTFDPPPAMVFLDAVHSFEETLKDIQWAQRIGVPIISGHDYSDMHPGVIEAVKTSGGAEKVVGTVWVLRLPG